MNAGHLLFAFAAGAMCRSSSAEEGRVRCGPGSRYSARADLIVALAFYRGLPAGSKLGAAPWWVRVGGLFGAFYVLGTVVAAPKLGAATLVALILAGPAVSSLLVDQFGWVGSLSSRSA